MRKREGFSLAELLIGIAILGVVGVLATSHIKPRDPSEAEAHRLRFEKQAAEQVITVTVEGHDYFRCATTHGHFVLSHKGNCQGCASLTAEAP